MLSYFDLLLYTKPHTYTINAGTKARALKHGCRCTAAAVLLLHTVLVSSLGDLRTTFFLWGGGNHRSFKSFCVFACNTTAHIPHTCTFSQRHRLWLSRRRGSCVMQQQSSRARKKTGKYGFLWAFAAAACFVYLVRGPATGVRASTPSSRRQPQQAAEAAKPAAPNSSWQTQKQQLSSCVLI